MIFHTRVCIISYSIVPFAPHTQHNCVITSPSSAECITPDLNLSDEAIQWLDELYQSNSSIRRRRSTEQGILPARRARRQALGGNDVGRGLNQEEGVQIHARVFLDNGEEARNESLRLITRLPTYQYSGVVAYTTEPITLLVPAHSLC